MGFEKLPYELNICILELDTDDTDLTDFHK